MAADSAVAGRLHSHQALERRTQEIGRSIFGQLARGPAPWERAWWDDRMMGATTSEPDVKVQLFRFVDALPALQTAEEIREHLQEYLDEAGDRVPWWLSAGLALAPAGSSGAQVMARLAKAGAMHMARRFIAGATPQEALATVRKLRAEKLAFTADLLGEAVISEPEAERYQQTCLEILHSLAGALAGEPEIPQIDCDNRGPIPRVNLSLKLSSLTARFEALHAETTTERVLARLRPILRAARENGAFVYVDMEQYAHKDLTFAIFKQVLEEPEFRDWADVGIVAQAYLHETVEDLWGLLGWAQKRATPVSVRLVKGAYWDYEVLHAQQLGWPVPVFQEKWRTDACYEQCSRFLMEHHAWLRPAIASHNVRSIAHGMAAAELAGVPEGAYEIQMLYGMGEPIQRALVNEGMRVRVYTPYGAMLPGMAYLVRRLLENTSNESFLKASFTEHARAEDLLRDPEEVGAMWGKRRNQRKSQTRPGECWPPFANEPTTDFNRADNRAAMRAALAAVRSRLGREYPLLIRGEPVKTAESLVSNDPSAKEVVVGRTAKAHAKHAEAAVSAAREAFPAWSNTPAEERADIIRKAAALLRRDRLELAALEVFECGKPWHEADADIAEAIDFCEYYARQMLRLAQPQHHDLPGETNEVEHIARGVAVVIPPWNFPLAIPTGMTVAALVAGNTVVLKPAEQSPVIAWELVERLVEAGLPAGVINYLPGLGEEVGAALVADSRVDLVAFTGSRAVGLEINRRASDTKPGQDHVKRVIAEMGGKNAIIVHSDADLDEAVVGVLQSAFGYSGQKCSACSRVIVLEGIYDAFLARLTEAAKALAIGPAEDPDTVIGPVIDAEAQARILRYQRIAATEGRVLLSAEAGALAERGHFVGPMIVADVSPEARVAQEEIFGPVLAAIKARDLDEALWIANTTEYALAGGIYSRSPAHIAQVRAGFRVGNLYINRSITGALVGRQPFGGFKLSGIGTKAGGADYLLEFLLPRTLTENTMRRGFAPNVEAPELAASGT